MNGTDEPPCRPLDKPEPDWRRTSVSLAPFALSVARFGERSRSGASGAPFDSGLTACAQGERLNTSLPEAEIRRGSASLSHPVCGTGYPACLRRSPSRRTRWVAEADLDVDRRRLDLPAGSSRIEQTGKSIGRSGNAQQRGIAQGASVGQRSRPDSTIIDEGERYRQLAQPLAATALSAAQTSWKVYVEMTPCSPCLGLRCWARPRNCDSSCPTSGQLPYRDQRPMTDQEGTVAGLAGGYLLIPSSIRSRWPSPRHQQVDRSLLHMPSHPKRGRARRLRCPRVARHASWGLWPRSGFPSPATVHPLRQ